MIKKSIACEKKDEISVKGIAHKIQTYEVIRPLEAGQHHPHYIFENFEGFSFSIDLNRSEKKRTLEALKKALGELERY